MEYIVLDEKKLEELIMSGFLPESIGEISNSIYLFGALDERNRLVGAIAFSEDIRVHSRMYLEYIYVTPRYRRKGISNALFDFAVSKFKGIKVTEIRFATALDLEDTDRLERLMGYLGLSPLVLYGRELIFKQGSLDSAEMEKVYGFSTKNTSVVTIEDYDDVLLKHFLAKSDDTGIYLSRDEYNPDFNRFYKADGEIKAAICVKLKKNGDLFIVGAYKDNELDFPYVIPFMMSQLVHELATKGKWGENVIVKVYDDNMAEAIYKSSSGEVKERILQEYILEI